MKKTIKNKDTTGFQAVKAKTPKGSLYFFFVRTSTNKTNDVNCV